MLVFRQLIEDNIELLRNWRNSDIVSKYLFESVYITKEDQVKWFNSYKWREDYNLWIVEYKGNKIGYVDIRHIDYKNSSAEPGVYICDAKYRGIGLGKSLLMNICNYVFQSMELNKIYGLILSTNVIALCLYNKCGFSIEGILKEEKYRDGKFHDVCRTYLLKRDWEKLNVDYIKGEFV